MLQRGLFPDAYEVEADALEALEELDVERGLACVREARRRDPGLANLDDIEAALAWLERTLGGDTERERVARAFLELGTAGLAPGAAAFADRALARFATLRVPGDFLDAEQRVPIAALLLVLGRADAARAGLAKLLPGRDERADLWAWLGDACALVDRLDEANAATVRALVLDATRADLFRLRHPPLRALLSDLRATVPDAEARELLLPEAWLRSILHIPPENAWLDPHESLLRARTLLRPGAPRASRLRRFTLLLYLDRSRPRGTCSVPDREEMSSLDPTLFSRFIAALRERE